MDLIGGLYFPAGEKHLVAMGDDVVNYQRPQREKALSYVTDFTLAADVGAHVGIFSRHFAQHFQTVYAFEPMANLRECLERNIPDNVKVWPCVVSDKVGSCKLYGLTKGNSGCSFIYDDPRVEHPPRLMEDATAVVEVEMVTIDSLNLSHLGLLKVDVQGADHLVLAGAAETFQRCKTVVLVEEKPVGGPNGPTHHIATMQAFMASIGATRREKVGADRIYTF